MQETIYFQQVRNNQTQVCYQKKIQSSYHQVNNSHNPTKKQKLVKQFQPNQYSQGYTSSFKKIIQITDTLLVGLYKFQPTLSTIQTILMQNTGRPLDIDRTILITIIKYINIINNSSPYCFTNSKDQLIFKFKFQTLGIIDEQQKLSYIYYKIKLALQNISDLLYIYGVKNGIRKNMALQKIQALKTSLKNKKRIFNIFKTKAIIQQNMQQQSIPAHVQYSNIQQLGQVIYINKTHKFELSCNNYKLQYPIKNITNNLPYNTQHTSQIKLAKKIINSELPIKLLQKANNKLKRQINLIKNIKYGSQYFLKYYLPIQQQTKDIINYQQQQYLLMDYASTNLSFWITNQIFSSNDIINIFSQIIQGVNMLHKSGIVHRDLKPQNIMLCQQGYPKIKIIDFSDSALIEDKYTVQLANSLGYSLPYSPIQCAYNCQFGVNKPSIDIWSLGIILYQLIYKNIPSIYYHIPNLQQFKQGISKNQLTIKLTRKMNNKGYLGYLEQLVHKIIQKYRIKIKELKQSVKILKEMIQEMEQLVEEFVESKKQRLRN